MTLRLLFGREPDGGGIVKRRSLLLEVPLRRLDKSKPGVERAMVGPRASLQAEEMVTREKMLDARCVVT